MPPNTNGGKIPFPPALSSNQTVYLLSFMTTRIKSHLYSLFPFPPLQFTPTHCKLPSTSPELLPVWTTSTCWIQRWTLSRHLPWPSGSDTIDDHFFLLKNHSSLGFQSTFWGLLLQAACAFSFISPHFLSFSTVKWPRSDRPTFLFSYFSSDHTPSTTLNTISILMTPKYWSHIRPVFKLWTCHIQLDI